MVRPWGKMWFVQVSGKPERFLRRPIYTTIQYIKVIVAVRLSKVPAWAHIQCIQVIVAVLAEHCCAAYITNLAGPDLRGCPFLENL